MRILLTGATGFVGRHLAALLKENGHTLTYVLRRPNGFTNEVLWDFIGPLPPLLPCDVIVHLAAYVDFSSNAHHFEQYQVNTVATMKLAALAKEWGSYFIFSSMAGVHGSDVTLIDRHAPVHPDTSYAVSKYLAEEVIQLLVPRYSLLRIGGIYGLDGPAHLGLNAAISAAVHFGQPPILKGLGTAKRNYICVRDVARWIAYLVTQYEGDNTTPRLLYLADTEIMTIRSYLQCVVDVLLPGRTIIQEKGLDGVDVIVQYTPPPFTLVRFDDYLRSIILKRRYDLL